MKTAAWFIFGISCLFVIARQEANIAVLQATVAKSCRMNAKPVRHWPQNCSEFPSAAGTDSCAGGTYEIGSGAYWSKWEGHHQ